MVYNCVLYILCLLTLAISQITNEMITKEKFFDLYQIPLLWKSQKR